MGWADTYCNLSLIDRVCHEHGVSLNQLLSDSRKRNVVRARHEAMQRLYTETNMTTAQIAGMLNRDHSTVSYAIAKGESHCRADQHG